MKILGKIGAIAFLLWGLLHIVGGSVILLAVMDSPQQGFAIYQNHEGTYTALSGGILGYFSYLLICIAIAVSIIAVRFNWRNSQGGLAENTILVGLTDIGLVIFLVLPGFVLWGEALLGLVFFVVGVVASGIACNAEHEDGASA